MIAAVSGLNEDLFTRQACYQPLQNCLPRAACLDETPWAAVREQMQKQLQLQKKKHVLGVLGLTIHYDNAPVVAKEGSFVTSRDP